MTQHALIAPVPDPGKGPYGRAVVNGLIRYLSVSSLKKGDNTTAEGCTRRWRWRYIEKKDEPQGAGAALGTEKHDEAAHYLTTGEKRVSAIVARGLHLLPEPGPDLIVEHEISGKPALSAPVLEAAGIPLVGKIDLLHARGVNVGGGELGDTIDPPNTIEVCDHKFVSSFDRNKSKGELITDLQMAGYAEYVYRKFPAAEHVRLSHHYFHTKKVEPAVKVTTLITREQAATSWEHAHGLARLLKDVAAWRGDPNAIDANTRACSAYGGCPHGVAGYCTAFGTNSLTAMFGAAGAALVPASTATRLPVNEETMNPSPANPALTNQFLAAMGAASATPPPAPAPALIQGFAEACDIISRSAWGWPALEGEAAAQFALWVGHPPPALGAVYPATGKIATIQPPRPSLKTAAEVIGLAQEMKQMAQVAPAPAPLTTAAAVAAVAQEAVAAAQVAQVIAQQPAPAPPPQQMVHNVLVASGAVPAQPQPQPINLLSPETPASNPALAAAPMTLPANLAPVVPGASPTPAPTAADALAAIADQAQPVTAAVEPQPAPAAAAPAAPARKPRASRKQAAAAATTPAASSGAPSPATESTAVVTPLPASGIASTGVAHADGFELYVNCIPNGVAFEDFQPKLSQLAAGLLAQLGGGVDIRASSAERLDHGKWRGEFAAAVATAVATGLVPAGVYYLDTRGSQLAEVAAEALAGYPGARGIY